MTIAFDRFKQFIDDDGKLTQDAALFIEALSHPQEWVDVTAQGAGGNTDFQNSWVNVGSAAVTAFYKDPFGRVHLKGHINTGASGTVIFTLPEGYRPSEQLSFTCHTVSGGGGSGGHSYCIVGVNGDITLTMSGASVDVSLDNVSFRV